MAQERRPFGQHQAGSSFDESAGTGGHLSKASVSVHHPERPVFPDLLRGVPVTSADQVWCSDITFIRLRQGFLYLVAPGLV